MDNKTNEYDSINCDDFDNTIQNLLPFGPIINSIESEILSIQNEMDWELSNVDYKKEPDLYAALNAAAEMAYLTWLTTNMFFITWDRLVNVDRRA